MFSIIFGVVLFCLVVAGLVAAYFLRGIVLTDMSYEPRHGSYPYDWARDGL